MKGLKETPLFFWRFVFCSSLPLHTLLYCIIALFPGYGFAQDYSKIFPVVKLLLGGEMSYSCEIEYDDSHIKYTLSDRGLHFYASPLNPDTYFLDQIDDADFNSLSEQEQLLVADKLLSTLFYGYTHDELKLLIDSGYFICHIRTRLEEYRNSISEVEEYIVNEEFFFRGEYYENEVHDILARLFALEHLDKYFLHNWIAYILTQTIMFSPSHELDSAHLPDVANVYNWLVMDMEDDISMRYSTYLHMTSLENWRRFRSPEDNGREMLEIFLLDFEDEHVPIAATALKNWYLDDDHDSLVIGLNENKMPLSLFGTTIYDGFDFYRELVKSDSFIFGVTTRLVDFFLTKSSAEKKRNIVNRIISSKPERWKDILLQLVFSKEYLLNSEREKSAEELFYSFAKKSVFKHRRYTFKYLNGSLSDMNQASMKYKLGKLVRTPLDSLSFANYHKFTRESLIYKHVCGDKLYQYDTWGTDGWTPHLIDDIHFNLTENDPESSLRSLIHYLFIHFIQREPTTEELNLFLDVMLRNNRSDYNWSYNLTRQNDEGCYYGRVRAAKDVLDYMSRLTDFYWFEKVQ